MSILADLSNAIICMVPILPLISNSSLLSYKTFGIDPRAPITIGITIIHMLYSLFSFLARSNDFSIFSLSYIFTLYSAEIEIIIIIINIIIIIIIIKIKIIIIIIISIIATLQ